MPTIDALFSTRYARRWLESSRQPRVLHVFESACNLVNEQGEVLSVVTTEIGKGPFNVVIPRRQNSNPFEQINVQSPVSVSADLLVIGECTICTSEATLWNPRPDWQMLHARKDHIANLFTEESIRKVWKQSSLQSAQSSIPGLLTSLKQADLPAACVLTSRIAGLGPGLTPAGDDFLMGALYAVWIVHPPPIARQMAAEIASTAAPLTTSLSAAWLRAAGRGQVASVWHNFFTALLSSDTHRLHARMEQILATGATSGADALAGFIGALSSYWEMQNHHVLS